MFVESWALRFGESGHISDQSLSLTTGTGGPSRRYCLPEVESSPDRIALARPARFASAASSTDSGRRCLRRGAVRRHILLLVEA
uniref:Uncharacterized protein n=1 Tax=Oryza meridionalis TaxID=40149 RepID=A0A0E0E536_9ORYZ